MKSNRLFVTATIIASAAIAGPVANSNAAWAQGGNPTLSNVIPPSESAMLHARIKAIDAQTREVTLLGRSGTTVLVQAGPEVRLDQLHVGDVVNAQYYRSVAFMLSTPSMSVPEDQIAQVVARPAQGPGGIGVRETRISGLVVGTDEAAHSVDIVDPSGGGVYTIDVTDPARQALLGRVKVGDTITAVVSLALAVSITPAPKSWF